MIETYACGPSKDIVSEKEEIKCNNTIKQYTNWLTLIINVIKGNIKEHNSNWPEIPDHPSEISLTGSSGQEKEIHYLI